MLTRSPITLNAPKIFDPLLSEIGTTLTANLSWLTNAYGMAEKRERIDDGRTVVFPGVYAGANEYVNMLPDEHLKNHCFFEIADGATVDQVSRTKARHGSKFGLIFWFDFQTVYPMDYDEKNIHNVVDDVLAVFRTSSFANGTLKIERYFTEGKNIYKGYTYKEAERNFLLRPYGGFKLEGEITAKIVCP